MTDEMDPMVRRLYATTNAQEWAEAFCKIAVEKGFDPADPDDVGWVIGWFANAIETAKRHEHDDAYDEGHEAGFAEASFNYSTMP